MELDSLSVRGVSMSSEELVREWNLYELSCTKEGIKFPVWGIVFHHDVVEYYGFGDGYGHVGNASERDEDGSFTFVSDRLGEITFRRVHYQEFNERFEDRLFGRGKVEALSDEDLSRLLRG